MADGVPEGRGTAGAWPTAPATTAAGRPASSTATACWCRRTATATRAPSSPAAARGSGRATSANGDVYDGGFVADQRQGAGTLTAADGFRYTGGWVDGPLRGRGQGHLSRRLGLRGRLQGRPARRAGQDHLCRRPQLRGRLGRRARSPARASRATPTGSTYEGGFRDGRNEGQGKLTVAGRLLLRRRLGGRARHGPGRRGLCRRHPLRGRLRAGPARRPGQDDHARRHGASRAPGRDGLLNGAGKATYPDGSVYEGAFVDGQRQGQGRMQLADGQEYEGALGGRPARAPAGSRRLPEAGTAAGRAGSAAPRPAGARAGEGVVRVAHRHEVQPVGRADRAAGGAVAGRERRADPLRAARRRRRPAPACRRCCAPGCAGTSAPGGGSGTRARPGLGSRRSRRASRVRTGLFAWQVDERKVVKSCRPTSAAAPSRIAARSSRWPTRQAKPRSWTSGARRETRR